MRISLLPDLFVPGTSRSNMDQIIKPNLAVDISHALLVCSSNSRRAEYGIHFFESEAFRFGHEEPDESGTDEG